MPSARRSAARQVRLLGFSAAAAVVVIAALFLLFLSRMKSREGAAPGAEKAYDVVGRAEELTRNGRYREAMQLLESHPQARRVDAASYEEAARKARSQDLVRRAREAEAAGDWTEALRTYDKLIQDSGGPGGPKERFRLNREKAAFHAGLALAEKAAAAGDWDAVAEALEEASGLGSNMLLREEDRERLRRIVAFSRLMRNARAARAEEDAASERKFLFEALRLRPDHPVVKARLAEIGAGPDASAEALARARAALAAGDLDGAKRLAGTARERWPYDPQPDAILAYVADRRFCDEHGMVFVSSAELTGDPEDKWGEAERRSAFCIDRYEYPGRQGELPVRGVSAVEAAAMCAERGGRLCSLAEWRLACGGVEGRSYPYGNEYGPDACNTEGASVLAVGSKPDCRSPFGIHDMSGNVAEWTAEVAGAARQLVAGGDWSGREGYSRCDTVARFNPGLTSTRVGFRCCRAIASPEKTPEKTAEETPKNTPEKDADSAGSSGQRAAGRSAFGAQAGR
jgi:hypothetical protein